MKKKDFPNPNAMDLLKPVVKDEDSKDKIKLSFLKSEGNFFFLS